MFYSRVRLKVEKERKGSHCSNAAAKFFLVRDVVVGPAYRHAEPDRASYTFLRECTAKYARPLLFVYFSVYSPSVIR